MALLDEKKRRGTEERMLGRVYGGPQNVFPVSMPTTPAISPQPDQGGDSALLQRVFGNYKSPVTPRQAPAGMVVNSPSAAQKPPYDPYRQGGVEVMAGNKLAASVFGQSESVQERMDRKRRATDGHKDFMEGFRKVDPGTLPGPSSDFNVDPTPAQPSRSLFQTLASAPQERMDANRRGSRQHSNVMAKMNGITGVHPAISSDPAVDPMSNTFASFVNTPSVSIARQKLIGPTNAMATDATSDTFRNFVNAPPAVKPSVAPREDRQGTESMVRRVFSNQTTATSGPSVPATPGINVNLTDRDKALKDNLGKMDALIKSGTVNMTPERMENYQQIRQQAGFLRGGTDRRPVGTDGLPIITNAPGTAGGGSRYSFQGTPEAAGRFSSAVSSQEYSPEAQASRITQREQFLDREINKNGEQPPPGSINIPGLIPKEKAELAKAMLNAQTQKDIAGIQGKSQLANTELVTQGVGEERAVTTEAKRMEVANAKKLADIQERYLNEKDPVKQKALERAYLTLTGKAQPKYQIASNKSVDAMGNQIERSFAVNPDNPSESVEIGGNGGDWAMQAIQSNPEYLKRWNAATPIEQQEILKKMRERRAAAQ